MEASCFRPAGMGSMMSDEEMMQATLEGAGPRPVPAGKVRRKKLAYLGSSGSSSNGSGSEGASGGEGGSSSSSSEGGGAAAAEPAAAAAAAGA